VLLNSPEAASRIASLGHYIGCESTLQPMVRELAIMTLAREFDRLYAWTSHDAMARQAGVRDEVTAALRDGKAPQGLAEMDTEFTSFWLLCCATILQTSRRSELAYSGAEVSSSEHALRCAEKCCSTPAGF
jgi:alkylhydroperoxidase family enzyme